MTAMIKCKACGAPLVFIKTINGKNMPCDAEPVRFNYKLKEDTRVVTKNGEILPAAITPDGKEEGYIPHWATCPEADKFRKGRR